MVNLLHLEESQLKSQDPGTVVCIAAYNSDCYCFLFQGPCLEFLLRHKIMDTLFTAARNNVSDIWWLVRQAVSDLT